MVIDNGDEHIGVFGTVFPSRQAEIAHNVAMVTSEADKERDTWRPHLLFGFDPLDPNARWAVTDGAGTTIGNFTLTEARAKCIARNEHRSDANE